MENGKVLYNNTSSLSELEQKALHIYENGTRKDFNIFFKQHFEEQYDYSISAFKNDLFQKAKGYTKINNENFTDALDEAFRQSSLYDVETYRNNKELADRYFTHLGKTKESQDMILDYIANDIDIDSDSLLKTNAKYFETHNVTHGLYAFPSDLYTVKGATDKPLERIADNLSDIMNNKQMELSLSSGKYMIGPIGVKGKTIPIAYHVNDIRSHLEYIDGTTKRVIQPNKTRGTGTINDIIDALERNSNVDLFTRHDELIGRGIEVESLWVKEDFYQQNKKYVHKLLKDNNIQSLDIIHASENTEKITEDLIERINTKDIVQSRKYKPTKGPKLKQKITQQTSKSLPKKSLDGNGKMAIGLSIVGLITGIAIASDSNNEKSNIKNKKQEHSLPNTTSMYKNSNKIDNSYATQMAQDISSYKYGKHMTGFVNF